MFGNGACLLVVRRAWRPGGLVPVVPETFLRSSDVAEPAAEAMLQRERWAGGHAIDLRASVPLPGGRWYVTVLAGPERRNRRRLEEEGQTSWLRRGVAYLMFVSVALWLAVCAILIAYLVKSALGVDMMHDPSPLHFLYELFIDSGLGPPAQVADSSLPAASMALTILA